MDGFTSAGTRQAVGKGGGGKKTAGGLQEGSGEVGIGTAPSHERLHEPPAAEVSRGTAVAG